MPKYAVIRFGEQFQVLKAKVIVASNSSEAIKKFEGKHGKLGYTIAYSIE